MKRITLRTAAFFLAGMFLPLALLLMPPLHGTALAENHDQDQVINVPEGDAEMNAAIAKARSTLPEFWKAHAAPEPNMENFALKVMIEDGGMVEHFWLSRISRSGSTITGVIDNEPVYVKNVKLGETYSFAEEDISDWMFLRNGKIVGNQTMRPLLKRMPKAQADQYRSMLEEP